MPGLLLYITSVGVYSRGVGRSTFFGALTCAILVEGRQHQCSGKGMLRGVFTLEVFGLLYLRAPFTAFFCTEGELKTLRVWRCQRIHLGILALYYCEGWVHCLHCGLFSSVSGSVYLSYQDVD